MRFSRKACGGDDDNLGCGRVRWHGAENVLKGLGDKICRSHDEAFEKMECRCAAWNKNETIDNGS